MRKSLKLYITSFLVIIFIASYGLAYLFISERYEKIIINELQSTAKMLAQQIILTRKWVALHGAVLVENAKNLEPNPFLKEPYVIDEKGKVYLKMNPAFVTREIAKLAERERGFYFRVVSLKAINPKNNADNFEKDAIMDFEKKGLTEKSYIGEKTFRYIIPLFAESSCLKCHTGYKVGDVRGALSIFLPIDELLFKLNKTKFLFFLLLTLFHIVVFSGFWLFFDKFVIKPVQRLALFAEGKGELEEKAFNIEELYLLLDKLKTAKIRDEKIKEILRMEVENATTELKTLNDKKSEFLLEIGHKLKTPLTVISACVDYLLMKKGSKEDEKYFDLLKKNVLLLRRALNQILKTAQLDMDIIDENLKKNNLSKILAEVLHAFDLKNIVLSIDEDLFILGAEEKLISMFENLIHNAVKFNKPDGKIEVKLTRSGEFALFRIKDEGIGIREEDKPNIFEKFYHTKCNDRERGTGLGLYMVKKIVEFHKGEIYFESKMQEGATFYIKLPLLIEDNG